MANNRKLATLDRRRDGVRIHQARTMKPIHELHIPPFGCQYCTWSPVCNQSELCGEWHLLTKPKPKHWRVLADVERDELRRYGITEPYTVVHRFENGELAFDGGARNRQAATALTVMWDTLEFLHREYLQRRDER